MQPPDAADHAGGGLAVGVLGLIVMGPRRRNAGGLRRTATLQAGQTTVGQGQGAHRHGQPLEGAGQGLGRGL